MSLRVKKQIAYWKATAEHDWQTVQTLWRTKRHDGCLFFCHLVIEKILKAVVVKITQQDAPRIHDLVRLANSAELALTESQQDMLAKINHFNITTRYPVDQKEFYKLATKTFSAPYYKFTKEFLRWVIENQL